MNLSRIFKNVNRDVSLSGDDIKEKIIRECRDLESAIFKKQPDLCFLRGWRHLVPEMYVFLTPEMVDRNLVTTKDICAICTANLCPHNKVSFRDIRIGKIVFLSKFLNK